MRWTTKKESPSLGQQRITCKFIWLPLSLQGESRWLEFADIVQIYRSYTGFMPHVGPVDCVGWRNLKWAEDDPLEVMGKYKKARRYPT